MLYRCICWLIVEAILRNARFIDEIYSPQSLALIGFYVCEYEVNTNRIKCFYTEPPYRTHVHRHVPEYSSVCCCGLHYVASHSHM